jgi:hypothetical protein
VYDCMDETTSYIIKTEDGTVYKWFIAVYVPYTKYENNVRNCVSRTKDDCTTWWEEPCDINEMVYRKPFGITAQYKSDGSIIMKYSKGKAAGQTLYYSPRTSSSTLLRDFSRSVADLVMKSRQFTTQHRTTR